MNTYFILEDNLDRLHKKINRIRTKCEKYGCGFYYEEVGEEYREQLDKDGNTIICKYIKVECEGTAVVNGWVFAATVEHEAEGNIIRNISGIEVPVKYRICAPTCEHCKSNRHRKNTYIVYNKDTREFKQVGSSCLADFTGGYSTELAAEYISLFDTLIEGEAPVAGSSIQNYYSIKEFLKYAVLIVDELGYTPTSYGGFGDLSTKDLVIDEWGYDNHACWIGKYEKERVEEYRASHRCDYDSDEVSERVHSILSFIEDSDDTSEYMSNLKVIVKNNYCKFNQLGYVVSMVACYNRNQKRLEQEAKRREASNSQSESNFVGFEGARISVNPKSIEAVTHWETPYGTTIRYRIYDQNDNCIMWDSSSGIYTDHDLEGNKVKVGSIVGTVKKLDTFNGVNQTWITRCRVHYIKVEEEHEVGSNDAMEAVADFLDQMNA